MKAILIDPTTRTITAIDVKDWRDIAPAIDADLFAVVNIDNFRHSIFVDDEGLYTKSDLFYHLDYPHQPLAGRGLVLGYDQRTGESLDCTLTIDEIKAKTEFLA